MEFSVKVYENNVFYSYITLYKTNENNENLTDFGFSKVFSNVLSNAFLLISSVR